MSIRIGSCSWNYDSWAGLVYSERQKTAADYLREYSGKYRTVEIDSWFYKIPDKKEAETYRRMVDKDFRFTCKVTNRVTLTHLRNTERSLNQDFLSIDMFNRFLDAAAPVLEQTDGIMFEFEYLNKSKMSGVDEFTDRLNTFFIKAPKGLPLAVETRNSNYLKEPYFRMLHENKVQHVFSEKLYMPPVYDVYAMFQDFINESAIIRLLGGDRKEIESLTGNNWDQIVLPKGGLKQIIGMINYMNKNGLKVTVNVNNHYEGSAPKTIEKLINNT